ncbi:polynucleotide kinase [Vibrio phage D479]
MKILELTIGVSASGKTTYAEREATKPGVVNLNRDDMRQELFMEEHGRRFVWGEWQFTKENEKKVGEMQMQRTLDAMARPDVTKVIISDTNLKPEFRKHWESLAATNGWTYKTKICHVTEEEAFRRDAAREMQVTKKVIRNQMRVYHASNKDLILQHFKDLLEEAWNGKVGNYVLSDIDGTVAEMHKDEPGKRKPYEWHRVAEDSPRQNVIDVLTMYFNAGKDITFFSGRDGVCRAETALWLHQYIPFEKYGLLMRQAKDQRPDWVVKSELLLEIALLTGSKPLLMLDDRNQVVDAMRFLGVEVWQVQPGDF